jgi:hypothetical protein
MKITERIKRTARWLAFGWLEDRVCRKVDVVLSGYFQDVERLARSEAAASCSHELNDVEQRLRIWTQETMEKRLARIAEDSKNSGKIYLEVGDLEGLNRMLKEEAERNKDFSWREEQEAAKEE